MKNILRSSALVALLLTFGLANASKEVAITIDDLPFVGNAKGKPGNLRREKERFLMTVEALKKYNVPATGFVVAGSIEKGQMELLKAFMNAGGTIANHTYSHPSLNRTSAKRYIENIDKADQRLAPMMGQEKFFRYPFLARGNTAEKYLQVKEHLEAKNYIIAPVTIDSKDFRYNARLLNIHWRSRKQYLNSFRNQYLRHIARQIDRAEKMAQKKVQRPIKQIFLIHMNYLNAYMMGDVLKLFQSRGYKFIPLSEAMKDPFYKKYKLRYTNVNRNQEAEKPKEKSEVQ